MTPLIDWCDPTQVLVEPADYFGCIFGVVIHHRGPMGPTFYGDYVNGDSDFLKHYAHSVGIGIGDEFVGVAMNQEERRGSGLHILNGRSVHKFLIDG